MSLAFRLGENYIFLHPQETKFLRMPSEKVQHTEQTKEIIADQKDLVLFNDDHNTFDFVIKSLVEICHHDAEQAEQCALITHLKGKCTISMGTWYELQPQHDQLSMRGLTVSIT